MSFVLSNLHINNLSNEKVSTIKQLVDYVLYLSSLLMVKFELMNYSYLKDKSE